MSSLDLLEVDIRSMRSDLIGSILLQPSRSNLRIKSDFLADVESLECFVPGQEVPFKIDNLFNVMLIDWRGGSLLRLGNVNR